MDTTYTREELEKMTVAQLQQIMVAARKTVKFNRGTKESLIRAILACQMINEPWPRDDKIIREFDCRMCGDHVVVHEWADKRSVFCCEHCEKRYWKHRDRYELNKDISQGHVIHTWQLKERDELAV